MLEARFFSHECSSTHKAYVGAMVTVVGRGGLLLAFRFSEMAKARGSGRRQQNGRGTLTCDCLDAASLSVNVAHRNTKQTLKLTILHLDKVFLLFPPT